MTDTTNSVANIAEVTIVNQEHQNYYDCRDQQYISCKYNGGLEQATLELAPIIILEEEEDGFHQWADQYDQWDNRSYTPITENDMAHLMLIIMYSTSQNQTRWGIQDKSSQ